MGVANPKGGKGEGIYLRITLEMQTEIKLEAAEKHDTFLNVLKYFCLMEMRP